jgi:phthiodiolone/phenolphthiodiolone dimycocerosates ketoreductase
LSFTMDASTVAARSAAVPLDVVRGMILNGTPDDVLGQAAVWRDHGVRHLVVVNFGPMGPSVRAGLATLIPFNTAVRRLKKL